MNQPYQPTYHQSWAIIIGVNRFQFAPPLAHACNDARAIRSTLTERFQFAEANVTLLLDEEATRSNIMGALLSLADRGIGRDDRVVFFFAGHGDTRPARRGDVGYLVPFDGNGEQLASLIRWDDLTRNAELIPAKHMLFLMDACYGGLALTRGLRPGSMRFATDMLSRYSRQVLTAGKADEVVSDGGGPLSGHSIFTGHLLDALDGKAAGPDGLLSASNVTAYVYERVAKAPGSAQSPHYGHIDGDGDLIFNPPEFGRAVDAAMPEGTPEDLLVQVPPLFERDSNEDPFQKTIKQYISDPSQRIALDDLAVSELKAFLHATREQNFPVDSPGISGDSVAQRLANYNAATDRLLVLLSLVAKWGDAYHRPLLSRAVARMADNLDIQGGTTGWLGLRWYPLYRVICGIAVAAVSTEQYENLRSALISPIGDHATGKTSQPCLVLTLDKVLDVNDIFKLAPGHQRDRYPISEHMFKSLQAPLEDLMFLGRSYESLFDRAEMFLSLAYADISGTAWYPAGRFAWKHKRRYSPESPLTAYLTESAVLGPAWPALRAGFFGGSVEKLRERCTAMQKHFDSFQETI